MNKLLFMKISLFILLLFAASINESYSYKDPNNFMQQLDVFLGEPDFDAAFKENHRFYFKNTSCLGSFQKCDTNKIRIEVAKKNEDEVALQFFSGESSKPSSVSTIKRSDWNSIRGNLVRNEIRLAESYGQEVSVNSLTPVEANVIVNGVMKRISAIEIELTISNMATGSFSTQKFKVNAEIPGVGQRIYREVITKFIGDNRDTSELISFND